MSAGAGRSWRVGAAPPDPVAVERLLRLLPTWFGIESAIRDYLDAARHLTTIFAWPDQAGQPPVGVLLVARHFPVSAEVHLMAVDPARHREGIGRALVQRAESDLRADGVRVLSVKTLGPSHPDPGYARTRAFYQALDFLPVEELSDLWPGNPCLIMAKFLV
jgi:GNAT superfamily N-acetyltransferase